MRWKTILAYAALAVVVLLCLQLVSVARLSLDWGRELLAAAIAVVAVIVGLKLAPRGVPSSAPPAAPDEPSAQATVDAQPPAAEALSPREREVLRLLADGCSNKELARALSVSENTIKTHLANLYAKLQVRRRTEALAEARRRGLL